MAYHQTSGKGTGKGRNRGQQNNPYGGSPYGTSASPYAASTSPYAASTSPYAASTSPYAASTSPYGQVQQQQQQPMTYAQQVGQQSSTNNQQQYNPYTQPEQYSTQSNDYQYQGENGYDYQYQGGNGYNYYNQGGNGYDYNGGGGQYEEEQNPKGEEDNDDAQLAEIFAAMDEMGVQSDDDVPQDIVEELSNLQAIESANVMTAPPSPTMNVAATEFVPGQGFVSKPEAATPPPPPASSTKPAITSSSSSGGFILTANAVNHKVDKEAIEKQNNFVSNVGSVINQGAYVLKQEGKFDLSFKGRKNVVFPYLEDYVKNAFPDVASFKQELKMDLRNFIAETLRPWEKNPDWYTPPPPLE